MKRLTRRQRERQIRRLRGKSLRLSRRRARTQLLANQAKARANLIARRRSAFAARYGQELPGDPFRYPIEVPEVLSLRDNFAETVSVLSELRNNVVAGHSPAILIFDRLQKLEPAATLILTAEIYRCRNLRAFRRGRVLSGSYPKDLNVLAQLREMGFFRLIEVDGQEAVPDGRPRNGRPFFIPFQTATTVDAPLAASFCELVQESAFEMNDTASRRMVAAVKEAMGNAVEHAYRLEGELQRMSRRWWLTGYVDPENREMMVSLFDQGTGIPSTLPVEFFERVRAVMKGSWEQTDGAMIMAATELHRTSTGEAGRGKGFRDMKQFIDTCDDGELWVLSNRGRYRYVKGSEEFSDEPLSIGGTLIEWRARHGKAVEVNDA